MPAVLTTVHVTKTYFDGAIRVEAVRGIDLSVGRGELLALVGPSGSGKSTLLSLMGAIDTPTSGEVVLMKAAL